MRSVRPLLLSLLLVLTVSGPVWADGCVFGKGMKLIPENSQQAFIEWDKGQERLYVATHTQSHSGPSVWVVPVPALPEQVKAEPVTDMPFPITPDPVVRPAKETVGKIAAGFFLTSLLSYVFGLFFLPTMKFRVRSRDSIGMLVVGVILVFEFLVSNPLGKISNTTYRVVYSSLGGSDSSSVEIHSHVEKYGLVVEVITAKSSEALNSYLAEKQMGGNAASLPSLAAYLEKNCTFVCSWAAPGQTSDVRAVRIDFPSADIFYPLLPTSAYQSDVATTIYVRGWVEPRPGTTLPRLRCHYERGTITYDGVVRGKREGRRIGNEFYHPANDPAGGEAFTRVDLSPSPQDWNEDLHLSPGAPAVAHVAHRVNVLGLWLILLLPAVTGLLCAIHLPWLLFLPEDRRKHDWVWAVVVGLGAGLTYSVSALVFFCGPNNRKMNDKFNSFLCFALGNHILNLILCALLISWFSENK